MLLPLKKLYPQKERVLEHFKKQVDLVIDRTVIIIVDNANKIVNGHLGMMLKTIRRKIQVAKYPRIKYIIENFADGKKKGRGLAKERCKLQTKHK